MMVELEDILEIGVLGGYYTDIVDNHYHLFDYHLDRTSYTLHPGRDYE
jgi:hypothetical protein